MAETWSGKQVIKILVKYFEFVILSQKGSHVKLRKIVGKKKITTVVPLHRELARGTLGGVLALAQVSYEEFVVVAK
jgi:predicted RNA binding protein YcfA (HicA-like mRNA interferase family)